MNLLRMTDHALTALQNQIQQEFARRTKAATINQDSAAIIHGNEIAKRALIVAAAGQHSILFVGPPNCGKTMMRAAALALGLDCTFEVRPCPCGWRTCRDKQCRCSVKQVHWHVAKFPIADITVLMQRPTERKHSMPGTTLADMKQQIANTEAHEAIQLDEAAESMLKQFVRGHEIDDSVKLTIQRVARTVTNLDRCEVIQASHMAEAVNYQPMWR